MKRLKMNLLACSIGMALLLAGCGDGGNGAPEGPAAGGGATPTPATDPPATIPDKPADPAAKAKDAPSSKSIPEAAPGGDKSSPAEKGKKKEIPEAAKKPAAKKPAAKKPAAKKPAAKKPAAKKDAALPTVDEQMEALMNLANQGRFAKSLAQIEVVLARKDLDKVDAQKRRNLPFSASQIALALAQELSSDDDSTAASAAFKTAVKHFQNLQASYKSLFPLEELVGQQVFYFQAVFLASKDTKQAKASLATAVQLGLTQFEWMETDENLDPLRKAGGFDKFIAQQKKIAGGRIAKEIAATKNFPFNFTLPDLDDKQVSLSSFEGKVVIVDIWGTWCPPCREMVPRLVKLQKTFGKQGLQVVGLTYERNADPKPGIRSFAKNQGINYPLTIGKQAILNNIPGFDGSFPTMLFIGRKGAVRLMKSGPLNEFFLETAVSQLLAEPAPAGLKAGEKKAAKKKPAAKKAKARKKKK